MYNGIGLTTPRGSGTNGYVQRNYSAISHHKERKKDHRSSEKKDLSKIKTENVELRLHEEKKKVEIELFKLKSELSKKGELTPEEIENKISEERKIRIKKVEEKFKSSNTDQSAANENSKASESSVSSPNQKNEQFKKALKLDQHFKEHGIENDQDAQLVAFDSNIRKSFLKRKHNEKSVTEKKKRKKSEKKTKQDSSSSSSDNTSSSESEEDS
ncbi:hypothetical protein C9374_007377 [Naegleria lovaniensis]|uniref:CWF21 domain-containing protein n=1 Tax=Naegleria lovaniensis TaxID=51637 RepID=A0AA88GMY4_NAELO|nr:uncharacterized protein C9374_007377 [Naegleria lovaniensis]KAG2379238.1 hypothetical protein C9374_007377 [Naegleria lovaniensis]